MQQDLKEPDFTIKEVSIMATGSMISGVALRGTNQEFE